MTEDGVFPKNDVMSHFVIPQGVNLESIRKDLFVDCYYCRHLIYQNIWLKKRTYRESTKPDEYSLKTPHTLQNSWMVERDFGRIQKFLKDEEWVRFAEIPVERTFYKISDVEFYVDHCKIGEYFYDVATSFDHVDIPKIKYVRNKIMQYIHVCWSRDEEKRLLENLGRTFRKSTKMIQDPYIDNTFTKDDIQRWSERRGIKSQIQTTGPTILCFSEKDSHLLGEALVDKDEIPLVMFWLKHEPGYRIMQLLGKDWDDMTDQDLSEMASWDPESASRFTPFSVDEMRAIERNVHLQVSKRIINSND